MQGALADVTAVEVGAGISKCVSELVKEQNAVQLEQVCQEVMGAVEVGNLSKCTNTKSAKQRIADAFKESKSAVQHGTRRTQGVKQYLALSGVESIEELSQKSDMTTIMGRPEAA